MAYTIFTIIGILLIVIGISFILVTTIVKKHYNKLFAACTARAIGKFDRFSRKKDRTGPIKVSYYPVFRYAVNGQNYYCTGPVGASRTDHVAVNDTVIYYNPNNPADAYTDRKTLTTLISVFHILGPALIGIGLFLVLLKIIVA